MEASGRCDAGVARDQLDPPPWRGRYRNSRLSVDPGQAQPHRNGARQWRPCHQGAEYLRYVLWRSGRPSCAQTFRDFLLRAPYISWNWREGWARFRTLSLLRLSLPFRPSLPDRCRRKLSTIFQTFTSALPTRVQEEASSSSSPWLSRRGKRTTPALGAFPGHHFQGCQL